MGAFDSVTRALSVAWLLAKRTAHEYTDDNCSHMAAAISYYVLFSVIPLSIFVISIFGLIVRDEDMQNDVASQITDFLNVEAGVPRFELDGEAVEARYGREGLLEIREALAGLSGAEATARGEALDEDGAMTVAGFELTGDEVTARPDNLIVDTVRGVSNFSGALTIVGLVGMAWSGSAMFGAIRKSLNIAWDTDVHRPVVLQKLVDLGMVASLGAVLGASVASTAVLRTARELSDEALGPLSTGTGFFWSVLPLFVPAILTFMVFALVYRYVPNAPASFGTVWPGALLATVLFEILKNAFALYIAKFNNYAGAYGALGGILLFMLWTYVTANILLIGAELASEYPRVLRGDYDGVEAPAGEERSLPERALRMVRGLFLPEKDEGDGPGAQGDSNAPD